MTAISTAAMSRDEWLKERTKGIGGSDVATILGLNVQNSPATLGGKNRQVLWIRGR